MAHINRCVEMKQSAAEQIGPKRGQSRGRAGVERRQSEGRAKAERGPERERGRATAKWSKVERNRWPRALSAIGLSSNHCNDDSRDLILAVGK